MSNWRLNQSVFWDMVLAYLVIRSSLSHYAMDNVGDSQNLAWPVHVLLVIALAFVIAARLNDAGYNRWIGIGATYLITMILPAILLLGYRTMFPNPAGVSANRQEFVDPFSTINLVPLVLLLALLIWAGTRPRAPQLSTSSSDSPPTM